MKRSTGYALLGFASIYIVWLIPSWILGWNEWSSFAYRYGDHIVLPLFNALAFLFLSKSKRIPTKTILLSFLVILPAATLIAFFEPNSSSARETETLLPFLQLYHSIFIFIEFSFIIFMCGVFPFLPQAFAPKGPMTVLYLLMGCFLGLVFIGDASMHDFPLWEKILPEVILLLFYIIFFVGRKKFFHKKTA